MMIEVPKYTDSLKHIEHIDIKSDDVHSLPQND